MKAQNGLVITLLVTAAFANVKQAAASDRPAEYLVREERLEAELKIADAAKTINDTSVPLADRIKLAKETYPLVHAVRITKEYLNKNASKDEAQWRKEQLDAALLQSNIFKARLDFAGENPEAILQEWKQDVARTKELTESETPVETIEHSTDVVVEMPKNTQPQQGFFAAILSLFRKS